ncbi:MerR family transcriptional regulator [Coprococcus comes]|uniref:MerR family transcriptional regulator n=1 Tax=Coprococcus comes TaxID=410072 RepID=UPI002ED5C8E6
MYEQTHYRYYDIKQNACLDMIQYMKELGMELKEIKEIPVPEMVQGSLVSGGKISILDGYLG